MLSEMKGTTSLWAIRERERQRECFLDASQFDRWCLYIYIYIYIYIALGLRRGAREIERVRDRSSLLGIKKRETIHLQVEIERERMRVGGALYRPPAIKKGREREKL
ncbi:hypothetical protein GOP47_0022127 [Adiantum capillus-veneris]|uniref:Uncharacterized protein n=1 Tax=Adiantum capillus-veneris TaxID=13818 RepID=A0A9D4Z786_ADICA|nr:hypothetical protein GOP47_0022127 [Adiantum capillus-veneris]